jgi:hypothetical protein
MFKYKGLLLSFRSSALAARLSFLFSFYLKATMEKMLSKAVEEVSSPSVSSQDLKSKEEVNAAVLLTVAQDEVPPSSPQVIPVPLRAKVFSILLVSAIGFGSNWSSGITGAMKTTIKKQMKINNTQFAVLDASEDFMITVLVLLSGLVTDRIGGAGSFNSP